MTLQDFAYLGNDITETTYGSNLERTVKDTDGNTVAVLKAEAFNGGVAMLDYAAVLRTLLHNGRGTIASGANRTEHDYELAVKANINNTDYIFVRAVSRRPSSLPQYQAAKFLTTMPELRHYKGYPLSVSFIIKNNNAGAFYVMLNGYSTETSAGDTALSAIGKCHATRDLTTNLRMVITGITSANKFYSYLDDTPEYGYNYRWKASDDTIVYTYMRNPDVGNNVYRKVGSGTVTQTVSATYNNGEPQDMNGILELVNLNVTTDEINIREVTVPVHPFYIRWVNNLGGWDYFMFACQHKTTKSLTENKSYEPYASSQMASLLYGVRKTYSKQAKSTIEVSSGVIDRQTLESLAEAVFSPLIQWYDESISYWVEIQVTDSKPEIMAEQPTGEMLISFELPTPQLNK